MNREFIEKNAPCIIDKLEQTLPCLDPLKIVGNVFNIQQFTVHDGPGIRTEIFLKGCYLRCKWCSNPESFEVHNQVGVYPNSCIGISKCGKCLTTCPLADKGAFVIENDKVSKIDRTICNNCMKCYDSCPSSALKQWGQQMSVEDVMRVIRADASFYEKSGGGVTISGGESLYQWRFTKEILKQCQLEGIHTCVETALHVKPDVLEKILPYTDLIITDIKHMNPVVHKQYTLVDNKQVLNNIKYLIDANVPVVLRVPIIPGVNDSTEHISEIADFIEHDLENKLKQIQFLRFRRLGEEKYASLGLNYNMVEVDPERTEFESHIKNLVKVMTDRGIPAFAGTTHKIKI